MQFLKRDVYKKKSSAGEQGFTLIELITVIVLLGIIGVMGSDIITSAFKGFSQTDAAMELFEEGKLALMRMEREIHHMVPNAVETPATDTIRFGAIDVNTLTSTTTPITGQYEPLGASLNIRDLSNNALDGALISIYNTSWNDFSAFPFFPVNNRKIYVTTKTGINIMTLDKPVIGGHSATKRYYPVLKAVQYRRLGALLYRSETPVTSDTDFAGTGFTTDYPLLSHLDTSSLIPLSFTYTPASLTRNALVRINFTLAHKGISLDFHKEIQVRNVP